MNRITIAFLEAQVLRLNRATGSPEQAYAASGPIAPGSGNRYVAQIGNYHLSGAYGGYSLHRMENDGGGISDVFSCGHVSKRELSQRISSMLVGIESRA